MQVAEWLATGEMVPFIGAGASLVVPPTKNLLPNGKQLAEELIGMMPGTYPPGTIADLAKVAQVFEYIAFDREALYRHLRKRFEVEQAEEQPSVVATMLAEFTRRDKNLFLITTNYDSFIERAFHAADRPICTIMQGMRAADGGDRNMLGLEVVEPDGKTRNIDSTEFSTSDFPMGCTFLFKMHGSVHDAALNGADSVIITEDDYVDFIVNSGGSVSPLFPPPALTREFKKRRFLFLGYSLYDWNFRAFLRVLALRNALSGKGSLRHWAVQLNPDPIEVDLWRRRNVNVHDGDLAEFCERLRQVGNREAS